MAMASENLKEILKLPFRNAKLTLSLALLLFLILLIPSSLLFLGDDLAIQPFIMGLFQRAHIFFQTESSATFSNESIESPNIDEETVFTIVSVCLSLLSITATISTTAMTYYDHDFSATDIFWAIVRIRWLLMTISALVLGVLISIFVAVSEGLINWVSIGLSSALLLVFSSIYLGVVWMVGHVVSALIRACDEVGALGSAGELLKGKISRRLMHSLLLTVVATAISLILAIEIDPTADMSLTIAAVNVVCLVILFLSVVYTLLWHECKKKQEGNVGVESGIGYSLVPTTTLLIGNDSLP
ncbi:hypothetical protein ACLOJK_002776 [Asimina triloba]